MDEERARFLKQEIRRGDSEGPGHEAVERPMIEAQKRFLKQETRQVREEEEGMNEPDFLKVMAETEERMTDEEREVTFREDWGMSEKKKETVQGFLTVLSGGLCQLRERISQSSQLLGIGPSLEPTGKDQTARSGTVGRLLDDLEGKICVVQALDQELGGILHELERI